MGIASLLTSLPALVIAATLFVSTVSAQDRTTEQGEAQIIDPTEECLPYPYAPVSDAMAAGKFPPIWTVATILANDTDALAKYQSIQSQILNISANGYQPQSLGGNFGGFTYPPNDPNCWWTYDQCTTPKNAGLLPDITTVPEPNTLGYGFDDGPSCSHNIFYDYLQQNNQKATMFYIGSNIAAYPLEAQRGLADGHEICSHTWSHHYTTALTNEEAFAELYYSMKIIKLVIGVTPTCWRPPYGDIDDRIRSIARALGLRTILWTYDSSDWAAGTGGIADANIDANYEALIADAQKGTFNTGGTIQLTHELGNSTMSEAIKFHDRLKAVFRLVPVGVAMNVSQPYIEANYSLPSFAQYITGTTVLTGNVTPPTNTSVAPSPTNTSSPSAPAATHSTSGMRPSFGAFDSLTVWAAFVGSLWRLLL